MFFNLLADAETTPKGVDWTTWILLIVIVAVFAVFMFISNRNNKKKQKETEDMLNAIKPGNKVKTIGGICGIVVEVDPEQNTFVLETGSVEKGKSYVTFDRQAIYQTDAKPEKVEKEEDKKEDKKEAEALEPAKEQKKLVDEKVEPIVEDKKEEATTEEKKD